MDRFLLGEGYLQVFILKRKNPLTKLGQLMKNVQTVHSTYSHFLTKWNIPVSKSSWRTGAVWDGLHCNTELFLGALYQQYGTMAWFFLNELSEERPAVYTIYKKKKQPISKNWNQARSHRPLDGFFVKKLCALFHKKPISYIMITNLGNWLKQFCVIKLLRANLIRSALNLILSANFIVNMVHWPD